jgi:hypothetical protein
LPGNPLAKKLEYKIIGQIGIPRASKFYHEFPKRWAAQTNCSPEYIIPECKQYKGTQEPEAAI